MQSQIFNRIENGQLQCFDICFGRAAVFSQRSPAKDTFNEDVAFSFEHSRERGVLGVFDGVGGAQSGDRAANQIAESLCESLATATPESPLRPLILDAIETANRKILEWGIGAASTLAVVELDHGLVRSYHVGDAMVLLMSNRGRIKYTTVAHAPTAMAVESGMLDEQDAIHHEERNLISNCVGCADMRIEIGPPKKMNALDTLVVSSDALSDNLYQSEITEILRGGNLSASSKQLVDTLVARMASADSGLPHNPDDHTFFVFRRARRGVS